MEGFSHAGALSVSSVLSGSIVAGLEGSRRSAGQVQCWRRIAETGRCVADAGREAALEADTNPFATVVLAHLAAQATRGDAEGRYVRKLALTRKLYERGLTKQRIIDLYRFIDWGLALPVDLELRYTDAILQIEEGLRRPYVSCVERRGEARGKVAGAGLVVRGLLEQRFGPLPESVLDRLDQADADQLVAWGHRVLDARTLEEVFAGEDG
jgi:hypothetical protein